MLAVCIAAREDLSPRVVLVGWFPVVLVVFSESILFARLVEVSAEASVVAGWPISYGLEKGTGPESTRKKRAAGEKTSRGARNKFTRNLGGEY
jgi:hypothetical protein